MKDLPIHYVQWKEVDDVGKEPTAWHLSHVVGWDEHKDLALLAADGHAIPAHQIAELANQTPALGDALHICGHPKGYYWTFMEGTVSGYRGDLSHDSIRGPFLQVQAPVYFGNSGGGAFDSYGKLVGIADMLLRMPDAAVFVHLDSIRTFLRSQHLLDKPKLATPTSKVIIGVAPQEIAPPAPVITLKKEEPAPAPKKLPSPNSHTPRLPPGFGR